MMKIACLTIFLSLGSWIGCASGVVSLDAGLEGEDNNDGEDGDDNSPGETAPESAVALRLEAAVSALIPLVTVSESGALVSYGAEDQWSLYAEGNGRETLSAIFGDFDEDTEIRFLLRNFSSNAVDTVSEWDPVFSCVVGLGGGPTAIDPGDSLEIAFYGTISNGPAGDRYYECLLDPEDTFGQATVLYGRDENGVIRVVSMGDATMPTTVNVENYGDTFTRLGVFWMTYQETTEGGALVVYLDFQYSQAILYWGVDGEETQRADNSVYKSRSQVTGRVVFDESNSVVRGEGDYTVTKYDLGPSWGPFTTHLIGRGTFDGETRTDLLYVENHSQLNAAPATFCLEEASTEETPRWLHPPSCAAFETSFPWGESSLPFSLDPSLTEPFEEKTPFEANNTDMISDDGGNFSIPSY